MDDVRKRMKQIADQTGGKLNLTLSVPVDGTGQISRRTGQPVVTELNPREPTENEEPRAGDDYATVTWRGTVYTFTPKQRSVVAALWMAWKRGVPFVAQQTLLEVAESDNGRLRDLFKKHPAWGTVIVAGISYGGTLGTYVLAWAAKGDNNE